MVYLPGGAAVWLASILRWVGSVEVGVALIWTYRLLALLKVEAARAWCRHVRQTCCSAWWRMVRIERAAEREERERGRKPQVVR